MENKWTEVKNKREVWSEAQTKKEVGFLMHLVRELALSAKGQDLRRQEKEAAREARQNKGRSGKRKAVDEQEVRQQANELGATVGDRFGRTAGAVEVNGYRDNLLAPAAANPGPPANAPE